MKPEYFMASESDGALYDTRKNGWYKMSPLRPVYSRLFRSIKNTQELRACLRARYALSYDTAFTTNDGACLCHDCVKENYRNVNWSIKNNVSDGWRVDGLVIECETDSPVFCDNCDKNIFEIEGVE